MVANSEFADWKGLWDASGDSDWDLDDMEALIDPDDWETFDQEMAEAYTEYLVAGGERGSVPWWLIEKVNDFLELHGIKSQVWWAIMYGR